MAVWLKEMRIWWQAFERELKQSAYFFMAFNCGLIAMSLLAAETAQLSEKFHFVAGTCGAWVLWSLLGVVFTSKKHQRTHS